MEFYLILADWFYAAIKPMGFKYYDYVLAYVDVILSISCDSERFQSTLQSFTFSRMAIVQLFII
jgi:hypothetical protein